MEGVSNKLTTGCKVRSLRAVPCKEAGLFARETRSIKMLEFRPGFTLM